MIERTLLDADQRPLLVCWRNTDEQALYVKEEGLPEVTPVGVIEDVGATGVRIYVGGDALRGGEYSLTLGTLGKDHAPLFDLQRTVMYAALRTRFIRRNLETLLVHPLRVKRTIRGSAQNGGQVEAQFAARVPFWLAPERFMTVTPGVPVPIGISGQMTVYPRIEIKAGNSAVVSPSILSDAGLTTVLSTIAAGQTLVLDARPGQWAVTLNGVDISRLLSGPQPYLLTGDRLLTVSAPGSLISMTWQEGNL
ncbi:hypothetical protein [Deinococcus humi]|uniref:Uncharacterized protein n=1 Tax=Deinococcus humi TaxID=662880 RepID=A0A7W8NF29_9DEIO|nr:hypothetical protein [Deinococcus humi]MBB5363991.1 hypothetical protein [Deinococcus humi]GGO32736.1 hypothetical protein GCM10008949_30770 [Deinococcus humi]